MQRCLGGWIALVAGVMATPSTAQQRPTAAPPAFKGVFTPVSFSEDIDLESVFFVTADIGWAAGAKGTLIHTRDGGATWEVQLGGDPQSAEKGIKILTFLDERTGWAITDGRILRTTDGENWQDLGSGLPSIKLLTMASPTDGVAEASPGIGVNPSTLYRTRDGGKTWKPVAPCKVKAQMQGLTREITCAISRIQFVSPTVGWAIGHQQCAGSCDPPPIFGKTEDGGETWSFFVAGDEPEVWGNADFFFTSETNGVVLLTSFPKGRLARTSDGGQTWTGLIASVSYNAQMQFADPEVGWVLERGKLTYTTDGGSRWNSRAIEFPTDYRDFSFPRRDRAYVVGRHGMVMRYDVVPGQAPVKAGMIVGPAMPAFASPLDNQVTEFQAVLNDVTAAVDKAAENAESASAPSPGAAPPDPIFAQDVPTPFVNACCGKPINKLSVLLGAVLQSLPQFVAKFKNTNLLAAGLRMLTTMPAQLGELRNALKAFRGATDKETAKAALAQLAAVASALQQSTQAAFQKEQPGQ